jgi:hypothetical protein
MISTWLADTFAERLAQRPTAAAITEMLMHCEPKDAPCVSTPVFNPATTYYTCDPMAFDLEPRAAMFAFMSAIDPNGYVQIDDKDRNENERMDRWAVQSRIFDVNRTDLSPLKGFVASHLRAIILYLVGGTRLVPVSIDEVEAHQNRPSQQALREQEARNGSTKGEDGFFRKKEGYREPKDPRIITTIETGVKTEYSRYTLAVGQWLKTLPWYAFITPALLAAQMVSIVQGCFVVLEVDFSRLDGTKSSVVRENIDIPVLLELFGHDTNVFELFEKIRLNGVRATSGFKYSAPWVQKSGSPDTSAANS